MSGLQPDDTRPDPKPKANGSPQAHRFAAAARELLAFLNDRAHKRFPETDSNVGIIVARLKEGFTPLQLRQVIVMKVREWRSDEDMARYLRPETLFGARKFSGYVGELVEVDDGPSEPEPQHVATEGAS